MQRNSLTGILAFTSSDCLLNTPLAVFPLPLAIQNEYGFGGSFSRLEGVISIDTCGLQVFNQASRAARQVGYPESVSIHPGFSQISWLIPQSFNIDEPVTTVITSDDNPRLFVYHLTPSL